MTQNFYKIFLFLVVSTFFQSCSKTETVGKNIEINDFVWGGMNAFYKWQSSVPNLSDKKFSSREELNSFLEGFNNPENLFQSLRYKPGEVDRFSWIVNDYNALEKSFQGIRTTTGMKAEIRRYDNGSSNLFIYVYDVVTGSSADTEGITRGMIFNKVGGQDLLESNYKQLLSNNTIILTLADYNSGNPIATSTTFTITRTQVEENPVKIAKVIEKNGKKIGYLMYNQFSSQHDEILNNAFAQFKSQGITDLIVDLRYNHGGSIKSAIYLGSMITGQFNGELFSQEVWNEKVMDNIDNNLFKNYFTNEMDKGNSKIIINSVEMTKVYFIVSNSTASASELVINALKSYINVVLVGFKNHKTVGKQVGSITLYDSDDYTKGGENFNKNHTWAMQPLVLEISNKEGKNNPNGYVPDVQISENIANSGNLGEETEPLLNATLNKITSSSRSINSVTSSEINNQKIWDSSMQYIDYQRMYTSRTNFNK